MADGAGQAASRAALVYNPIKVKAGALRKKVRHFSSAAGWAAPIFAETTVEDLGQDATRRVIREGADAVLVAGGDGTVRAVAAALVDTGIPLAIVPSGTGNLLARNLNLPMADPDAMIRAAFGDIHQPIDIGHARIYRTDGTVDEETFVVMAGIGLDAAMIANTSPQLKKTMGWIAYVDGAARSLPGAKPFRVMYELDGEPHPAHSHQSRTHAGRLHSTKAQSMLFANCGALPAGIALIPDASLSDGLLDVALIQPTGWFGWLGVWRKVWWDNSVLRRSRAGRRIVERRQDSSVRYLRGSTIEAAAESPQPVEIDGDGFGEAVRIRCSIVPGGLLIALPAGHALARM